MFSDILRAFIKTIAITVGIFIGLMPLVFFSSIISSGSSCFESKTILTCLPDLNGERKTVSSTAPVILRINIHGLIGESVNSESVESQLVDSRSSVLKGDRVKAILLHLNTPGGAVNDSDVIYRAIKAYKEKYKVPVYAYVDGLCASGGMYIACSSDKIYSSPVGIIGSVGVILGPFFNFSDSLTKLGIESKSITRGKNKDMMSPFRKWREGEDTALQALTAYFYKRFVSIVSNARPNLDKELLIDDYGANIYDAPEAQKLGYIDVADSSYEQAMYDLMKEAKMDPNKPYQIIELVPKKQWLSQIFANSPLFTGKIKLDFSQEKFDPFLFLFKP